MAIFSPLSFHCPGVIQTQVQGFYVLPGRLRLRLRLRLRYGSSRVCLYALAYA